MVERCKRVVQYSSLGELFKVVVINLFPNKDTVSVNSVTPGKFTHLHDTPTRIRSRCGGKFSEGVTVCPP